MPYYRLFYHMYWTTKNRLPMLSSKIAPAVYACIVAKAAEHDGIVHAINSMPDHIHIVVTLPPSLLLSRFVGEAKGVSSHLASRLTHNGDPFVWRPDYAVISVSEQNLPTVVRYVERQAEHHRNRTLIHELETLASQRVSAGKLRS